MTAVLWIPVWRPYNATEVAETEGPLDLTTHNRRKATKTVPTIYQPQYPAKYSGHGVIMSSVAKAAPVTAESTSCEATSQSPLIKRTKKQKGERFSEEGETGVTMSAMGETASVSTFHDATPGRAPTEYTKKQTEGEDKQADASSAQQPSPLPDFGILGRSEEELLPWPLVTPQDVEYYIGLPLYASISSSLGVATSIHADADTSEESPSRRGKLLPRVSKITFTIDKNQQ
ncbi:uncharacterized protein LOC126298015 [Schistocerca gregaria]|uniref:uncharacterized protein LOC126298015 n=1 Tax=Schistocerca gregaria TaxID=7010 RepID=UPI00211E91F2|nr:uncharacterized protein LOC126298015 [Schistocerca gregaria]